MTYSRHFVKLDYPYKKYLKSFDYSSIPGELHTTALKKNSENPPTHARNLLSIDPTGPPDRDQIRDFNNNVCQRVAMHEYTLNHHPNKYYNEQSFRGLKMHTKERPKSMYNTKNIFSKDAPKGEAPKRPIGLRGSSAMGKASSLRAR
jgi:hypothetical protein